jgi:hypothetical protein
MTGTELRMRREALCLSIGEFAKILNVTIDSIRQWENLPNACPLFPKILELALTQIENDSMNNFTFHDNGQTLNTLLA